VDRSVGSAKKARYVREFPSIRMRGSSATSLVVTPVAGYPADRAPTA
jgi:hypothetical protein